MYYRIKPITKMCYRITDGNGGYYSRGYNSQNLDDLSRALRDLDYHFWKENNISRLELLSGLKENCDNFCGFYIEKQKEPFDEKDLDF